MQNDGFDLSVLVRVRNEKDALERLLSCLREQTFQGSFEIVVVDNESEDGSAQVALEHGARVFSLPRHLFTYGRAINAGVRRCRADLVVLLSAHAWPQDKSWLQLMANALEQSPGIDAAYCCQRPESPVGKHEELRFANFLGNSYVIDREFVRRRVADGLPLYRASYFSNSACIIRRKAVSHCPMRDLPYAEENAFALDCIVRDRSVAYLATPAVYYEGPISSRRLYEQSRRQTIAEKLLEEFYIENFVTGRLRTQGPLSAAIDVASVPAMIVEIAYRALFDSRYRFGSRALTYDICAVAGIWGRFVGALTWREFKGSMAVDQEALREADAMLRELRL